MSISNLAGDTICDILSRIPVRSIVQFKCVCKSWYSLISSPHFVKLQLNRVVNDVDTRCNRLLLSTYPVRSIDLDCDDVDDGSVLPDFISRINEIHTSFKGSCNGLICAVFDRREIAVFNPTTRDLIKLPKPSILSEVYFHYGFGYDFYTDDYKLLRISNPNRCRVSGEPVLADIFSMRKNCWRNIDVHPTSGIREATVFLKGALHGLAETTAGCKIVTFDLKTERFELMSIPEAKITNEAVYVGVLRDCLLLTRDNNLECELWTMKEYGVVASWTKLCTISYRVKNTLVHGCGIVPICVCLTKDGELLMQVDEDKFVFYDPKKSTFRSIDIEPNSYGHEYTVYFETLVSPRIGQ